MSLSVVRTATAWYVLTPGGAVRVETAATTTRELLADRAAVRGAAAGGGEAVALETLSLVSPVTAPCRVVAQMANYVSHARESGLDPARIPLAVFRKSSGSLSGPYDDVVRPTHAKLLDYEVEIGLVLGRALSVGEQVTAADLDELVAGLVLTNDVSARDLQLPKTQFFESKSYPTFTPTGPVLVLLEPGEVQRLPEVRLQTWVNGELRQDSTAADMIYRPLQVLQLLSGFQQLDPGDLVLTGTPGGTALKAPAKPVELLSGLLPTHVKWGAFVSSGLRNAKYLKDGDAVELAAATPDGALDLGRQRTVVKDAR
jgi:2-keto-4-pentenoate hydratase/2-oxohepta-3-ene-1,7-dioic acid hydratase in catechol pathway